jgi:hypothetical protein
LIAELLTVYRTASGLSSGVFGDSLGSNADLWYSPEIAEAVCVTIRFRLPWDSE